MRIALFAHSTSVPARLELSRPIFNAIDPQEERMHRDAHDHLETTTRLMLVPPTSAEVLPLDAQADVDRLVADDDVLPARPASPASVLTPAVERVLAWHHRLHRRAS